MTELADWQAGGNEAATGKVAVFFGERLSNSLKLGALAPARAGDAIVDGPALP
jgi:hypothetical protein